MSTTTTHDSSTAAAIEMKSRGVRRVLWTTLALNLLVSGSKVAVGTLSGSLSMVADGYHSLMDGTNNLLGLFVAAFAYAPPDRGHPYGHRKFETAATLAIALALLGVSYGVLESALGRFGDPRLPDVGALSWTVMGATLLVNLFVAWYETREGRRLGSSYLVADAAHTRSDVYVTLGVVGSFAGARAGIAWMDPVVSVAIAAFIAVLGVRILVGSFHTLTDRAVIPPEDVAAVVGVVPGVVCCVDVRSRGGAEAVYLDLVVHVDGRLPLREAHAVADQVERALGESFPQVVDVVVHVEPAEGT